MYWKKKMIYLLLINDKINLDILIGSLKANTLTLKMEK